MRLEWVGGGPLSAVGDSLLRQALEAALAVAREGEEDTPEIPAPPPVRPFLRFAKLPPAALAATRRALDTDVEFRERVAEEADEAGVGRAGWLFLTRPDGWEEELKALVTEAESAVAQEADRRAENDARRRLAGAEQATRRLEQAAATARAEASQAASTLAEERRARQLAAEEAASAARKFEQVVGERDRARTSAAAAATERDRAKAAAAAAAAEADALRRRVAELEADLAHQVGIAAAAAPVAVDPVPADAGLSAARTAEVGRALREAAAAARSLAAALSAAAVSLEAEEGLGAVSGPAGVASQSSSEPMAPRRRSGDRRGAARSGRTPVRLPPAIFDDSREAAEHLVRVNGVALVVDGYNVSQTGWADLPLADQRRHLVTALNELAARTGADVWVVFDGAELAVPGAVPTTAQAVRVSFSPPGVEADDEILDLVSALPDSRPVVVATSDKRVQQGSATAGANVISSPQLLAALRR